MSFCGLTEQMTPKERIKAFKEGKPYDRIPCSLNVGAHAARVIGIKVSEYHQSADRLVEAQVAAYKKYGTESVGLHPNIIAAIGAKVIYPEQSTPYVAKQCCWGLRQMWLKM
ncbi:MAG TPA: uroporphyrinogen decarboxylase family protein [Methylomusa anaerophila]|uniref:Uroporphyrinogen decarboxylase n=1 Tax=Methylomusa anaerophila TaxID=1930071 RepID=A0A348AF56_9FIRM|nr:uroporphyrinogen decarboxylase family protein [Methylomusa anaerophila]BBB89704.1 uroporphyrinogen decarboxylase [Methylomusa anaerophila]HML89251.1 uroporphyrinogen decarboxylase family protein [Methylomusa anaerophila]